MKTTLATTLSGDRLQVPSAFKFLAIDGDGFAYAYELRPTYYNAPNCWLRNGGGQMCLGRTSCPGGEDDIYEVNHD